ncbi:Wdr92, partial [Symbiodinium sp. KB8]
AEKKEGFKCGTFAASSLEDRHLATGNFGGELQIWDLEKTESPIYSVKAHKSLINQIDGCGGLGIGNGAPEIATCGRDGCVKIWDPRVKEPVVSLEPSKEDASRDCWTVAF